MKTNNRVLTKILAFCRIIYAQKPKQPLPSVTPVSRVSRCECCSSSSGLEIRKDARGYYIFCTNCSISRYKRGMSVHEAEELWNEHQAKLYRAAYGPWC